MTLRILRQTMLILVLTTSIVSAKDRAPRTTIALTMTVAPDATQKNAERAQAVAARAEADAKRAQSGRARSDADVKHLKAEAERTAAEAERAVAATEQAEALLVLLEAEASSRPGLAVVERRQIKLALHELILSRTHGKDSANTPQLGKLATADLIVSVRLLKATADQKRQALVRIAEPLTGVIRGATSVQIDNINVEEVAEQIVHYVNAVIRSPETAGLTVSVAPFESEGKFGHVRPLELIVRDLMTEQLRHDGGFQVLQRTDMSGLLDELDLVVSGLASAENLPATLPSRAGVYHVHGTVNERIDDENNVHMVVNAKLTKTSTGEVILSLKKEFHRKAVARSLRQMTLQIADALRGNRATAPASATSSYDEAQELLDLALRDTRRFIRKGPHSSGFQHFSVRSPLPERPAVAIRTELASHLFRKTIDRLETVLFLEPEQRSAQFALAYCYSFHLPGIWNPERCEHLYRQVIHADKNSSLAIRAFRRLMAMYVHHYGHRRVHKEHIPLLIRQMDFVFATAPPGAPFGISREVEWLTGLHVGNKDYSGLLQTATLALNRVQHKERFLPTYKYDVVEVANAFKAILSETETPEDVRLKAQRLVDQWARHSDPQVRRYAFDHLSAFLMTEEQIEANHLAFVGRIEQMHDKSKADLVQLKLTADYFLKSKRPELAVRLLTQIDAEEAWPEIDQQTSYDAGRYFWTLGEAYEALGQLENARDAYLSAAEGKEGGLVKVALSGRITKLGGVPLRSDRAIDVEYHRIPPGEPYTHVKTADGERRVRVPSAQRYRHGQVLATDGEQLFCGKLNGGRASGICVLDLRTGTWRDFEKIPHAVSCLEFNDGILWAGTQDHGLWKVDLSSGNATQYTEANGLPAETVVSMTVSGDDVYAAVSESDVVSGGVIHISPEGTVRYLDGGKAPPYAPTSMLVVNQKLLAVSKSNAYQWDRKKSQWSVFNGQRWTSKFFHENDRLWAAKSAHGLNLKEVKPNGRSYSKDAGDIGHRPHPYFLIDHGDYLWLGGKAWNSFRSSGFYRVHKETGELDLFGPRDGFAISGSAIDGVRGTSDWTCYDGVFVQNRFWLATSLGIAEVTVRPDAADRKVLSAERR